MKRTHGHSGGLVSEYNAWKTMRARCCNPANKGYRDYGARGITICERWASYENFISDMGPKPSPAHSIDRRDNDGNYEPGNCRWTIPPVQTRNKRNNVMLTFAGETLCLQDWAVKLGIRWATLQERLLNGWPLDRALTCGRQNRWSNRSNVG